MFLFALVWWHERDLSDFLTVRDSLIRLRWWDLRNLSETHSITLPDAITSMELSVPKSTLVVASGKDVSFVPLVPNSAPARTLTLQHAPSSASLHPTLGDRFVAGSTGDPWVRVYGLENGEEREVYKGHHGPVHCIEYSPDGEMYASGSGEFIQFSQLIPTDAAS